jgi:hypothetical protein
MVFGNSSVQKHSDKVTLLPPSASQKAAGKSPPIQPGQRDEDDDGEHPGTDQLSDGSHAETDSQGTGTAMPAATAPAVEFPLCHAAVENIKCDTWALADAILAECSEPGPKGVRTGSNASMEKMRAEIARNHGIELSFERVRKLRKAASTFPPGRRRPAEVSLEAHLEAGTPDELDELIRETPGAALTVSRIRQAKAQEEKAQREKEQEERRTQTREKQDALQDHHEQRHRESEHLEESPTGLDRSAAAKPPEVSPPAPKKEETPRGGAEALTEALRVLVKAHGIDPGADKVRRAIQTFVAAVTPAPAK